MCFGGSSPKVQQTAAVTPVVQPSQAISDDADAASAAERRRLQSIAGQQSTILTGGAGAATPTSGAKTLIGS